MQEIETIKCYDAPAILPTPDPDEVLAGVACGKYAGCRLSDLDSHDLWFVRRRAELRPLIDAILEQRQCHHRKRVRARIGRRAGESSGSAPHISDKARSI